jgi:hypothetical protein
MRSAVDIPVISLTETALLIGCSLGRNLVAISNAPAVAWMTRTSVDAYQLQSPVLDVFGAAWSYALMMARLWERTGLRVGRAWQYRREDTELIGIIHDEHKGG